MISVIICTYNRCASLKDTLESLIAQKLGPETTLEVIVVDNNSKDKTKQVVEAFAKKAPWPVRYYFEPKQGLSHARNRGIHQAKGDFLAFTDDDVIVEANWIKGLYKAHLDYDADCVGGRILPFPNEALPDWAKDPEMWGVICLLDHGHENLVMKEFHPGFIFGASMSFRKQVFDDYGLFDARLGRSGSDLFSSEESALIKKLFESGKKVVYTAQGAVFHKIMPERRHRNYMRRWRFYYGRSYVRAGNIQPPIRLWLIRECIKNALQAFAGKIQGRKNEYLRHEKNFWFQFGMIAELMNGKTPRDEEKSFELGRRGQPSCEEGKAGLTPRVSIILTTYNRADLLKEAVDSVLAQTYKNWELIIVDDGSTDNTRQIAHQCASTDSRIRYVFQQNQGVPGARAKGLQNVKGDYITFLDDDDAYFPNKLEDQVACLDENPDLGMVYSEAQWVDAEKKPLSGKEKKPALSYYEMLTEFCVPPCAIMVRRECFDHVGTFSRELANSDDLDMWLRIAQSYPFRYLDCPVALYRWHEANISHNKKTRLEDSLHLFKKLIDKKTLSKQERKIVREKCARYSYLLADGALEAKEFMAAGIHFLRAGLFFPGIGLKMKWSRFKNPGYRFVRPYAASLYCFLMALLAVFFRTRGRKNGVGCSRTVS